MLAKKYRLSRGQIGLIYKKGKKKSFGKLSVRYLGNRVGFTRFGISVSAKVYNKATARNRLCRIIYDELAKSKFIVNRDMLLTVFSQLSEEEAKKNINEIKCAENWL